MKRNGLLAGVSAIGLVFGLASGFGSAPAQAGLAPQCGGEDVTIFCSGGVCKGTKFDDVMLGTPGPDEIKGGFGDDIICGEGGADILRGGWGQDTLFGGEGNDTLHGGRCDDVMEGGVGGADVCQGGWGADTITGCEVPVGAAAQQGKTGTDTASKCS